MKKVLLLGGLSVASGQNMLALLGNPEVSSLMTSCRSDMTQKTIETCLSGVTDASNIDVSSLIRCPALSGSCKQALQNTSPQTLSMLRGMIASRLGSRQSPVRAAPAIVATEAPPAAAVPSAIDYSRIAAIAATEAPPAPSAIDYSRIAAAAIAATEAPSAAALPPAAPPTNEYDAWASASNFGTGAGVEDVDFTSMLGGAMASVEGDDFTSMLGGLLGGDVQGLGGQGMEWQQIPMNGGGGDGGAGGMDFASLFGGAGGMEGMEWQQIPMNGNGGGGGTGEMDFASLFGGAGVEGMEWQQIPMNGNGGGGAGGMDFASMLGGLFGGGAQGLVGQGMEWQQIPMNGNGGGGAGGMDFASLFGGAGGMEGTEWQQIPMNGNGGGAGGMDFASMLGGLFGGDAQGLGGEGMGWQQIPMNGNSGGAGGMSMLGGLFGMGGVDQGYGQQVGGAQGVGGATSPGWGMEGMQQMGGAGSMDFASMFGNGGFAQQQQQQQPPRNSQFGYQQPQPVKHSSGYGFSQYGASQPLLGSSNPSSFGEFSPFGDFNQYSAGAPAYQQQQPAWNGYY